MQVVNAMNKLINPSQYPVTAVDTALFPEIPRRAEIDVAAVITFQHFSSLRRLYIRMKD